MTEAATPPTPDAGNAPATDWTASFAPDLKEVVTKNGFTDPAAVVKAYQSLQPIIGAEKITLPKDGVWDEFSREKLGIPKDPSGYKIEKPTLPEGVKWDENFEKAAMPVLHKLGLTPAQATGLIQFYAAHQVQNHNSLQEAESAKVNELTSKREEAQKSLKTEWGQKYDQNIAFASRAVQHIGGADLANVMNETGFGDHPAIIKAFAKIGEMLGEDVLKTGKVDGAMTPAEAKAEAARIMATPDYSSKDPALRAATIAKVQKLMGMAYDNTTDIRRGVHVAA